MASSTSSFIDHCQANSLRCTCRRSRSELDEEKSRRTDLGRHEAQNQSNQNDNSNNLLQEFCSKVNPLEFFCHFSPSTQKWCCTDCNHAIADHFQPQKNVSSSPENNTTVPTEKKVVAPPPTSPSLVTFNKGDFMWNKVSKCFSTVVSTSSASSSSSSSSVLIRFVNFMNDTPFWKPFAERRVESCEHPCVTHQSLFTDQQKQDLEKMLAEEAQVDDRTKKGIRVCPQPPCSVCGHHFCYETVGEDPSDLGGWSVVCCPVNNKNCDCKFCVWKNRNRRPIDGENGCCQCAKKAHERR